MRLPFKVKRGFDGHRKTSLTNYLDLVTQLNVELDDVSTLPAIAAYRKRQPAFHERSRYNAGAENHRLKYRTQEKPRIYLAYLLWLLTVSAAFSLDSRASMTSL